MPKPTLDPHRWTAEELARIAEGRWTRAPEGVVGRLRSSLAKAGPGDLVIGASARFPFGVSASRLEEAPLSGLFGVMCEARGDRPPARVPQLVVEDVVEALGRMGQHRRKALAGPAFMVTGSAGKTTTCALLRTALVADGRVPWASEDGGNLGPSVAFLLATLPPAATALVVEAAIGQLAFMSRLASPHVAVVTSIAEAHLANFGSLQAVAEEKGRVYAGIVPGGAAVVNADTPHAEVLLAAAHRSGARVVTFGTGERCDARLLGTAPLPEGGQVVEARLLGRPLSFALGAPGTHVALDALAALAALGAAGLDPFACARAFATFRPVEGRGTVRTVALGARRVRILDEAHNANPLSMRAALRLLVELRLAAGAQRHAVLGDMLELGPDSPRHHDALVDDLAALPVDRVHAIGPHMRAALERLPAARRGLSVSSVEELAERLRSELGDGDVVLLKASHGIGLHALPRILAGPVPVRPGAIEPSRLACDLSTGEVFVESDADRPREPASLTKLMTLLLALDAIAAGRLRLDEAIPVSARARNVGGSLLGLHGVDALLVHDALSGLCAASANDAAVAIAERLLGSEAAFVAAMNERARALGLDATRFTNATGLGTGATTTAREVAGLLGEIVRTHPRQVHWLGLRSFVFQGRIVRSTNLLLDAHPTILGGKTGLTPTAGAHLAVLARTGGRTVAAIALGCRDEQHRMEETASLLAHRPRPALRSGDERLPAPRLCVTSDEIVVGFIGPIDGDATRIRAACSLFRAPLRAADLAVAVVDSAEALDSLSIAGVRAVTPSGAAGGSWRALARACERSDLVLFGVGADVDEAARPLEIVSGAGWRLLVAAGVLFQRDRERAGASLALSMRGGLHSSSRVPAAVAAARDPRAFVATLTEWGRPKLTEGDPRLGYVAQLAGAGLVLGYGPGAPPAPMRDSVSAPAFDLGHTGFESLRRGAARVGLLATLRLHRRGKGFSGRLLLRPYEHARDGGPSWLEGEAFARFARALHAAAHARGFATSFEAVRDEHGPVIQVPVGS